MLIEQRIQTTTTKGARPSQGANDFGNEASTETGTGDGRRGADAPAASDSRAVSPIHDDSLSCAVTLEGIGTMARKDSILKLRDLLLKRRDALRKALAGDLSMLKSLRDQIGGDVVDFALDAAQDEISSKLAEVESRELANIEVALERIKAGTYGQCDFCGGKIPLARLNALPYATNCIDCQRAAETGAAAGYAGGDWGRMLDTGAADIDVSFSDLETS